MFVLQNNIVVISDFHLKLNDNRIPIVEKFFDEILIKYENIVIAGDFFDFFYCFPKIFPEGYLDILYKLKLFAKKKKIFYIEGNHDFSLKNFFNIITFDEKFFFKINDKVIGIVHGDTIDKSDKKYRFLRGFLRSIFIKFLMDNLPPYVVLQVAEKLSSSSEKYLRKKEDKDYFKDFFKGSDIINENFDILISGHFHVNDEFEINNKKIFLLNGIENDGINYLHIERERIEFRKWKF